MTIFQQERNILTIIYIDALPHKTQMLQIVTLRSNYQYQIAYLFITNLTQSAT